MASTTTTAPTPTPATITITDHNPNPTNNVYDITFQLNQIITTTVTPEPSVVTSWITTLLSSTATTGSRIIGLDIEWRPNRSPNHDNPVATLQLCTKLNNNNPNSFTCLVFQILHSPQPLPNSLAQFLADDNFTFVGAGIESDVEKLLLDYDLRVGKTIDLGVAAKQMNLVGLSDKYMIGLKELAKVVLGVDVVKPKSVTMSRWDQGWLSYQQIQYAAVDAFLSYRVGARILE